MQLEDADDASKMPMMLLERVTTIIVTIERQHYKERALAQIRKYYSLSHAS